MTVKVMMIQEKTVKNTCADIKDVQCESIRTGKVLSMCIVSVQVWHKNSGKEITTFAVLNTCSQGTFITTGWMGQLKTSGMQTFIDIKTLIGHQKESSYIVEGLSVSKAPVSDGKRKWINLPSAFSKKETLWIPVKSQPLGSSRNGISLKRYLRNLVIMKTSVWIF